MWSLINLLVGWLGADSVFALGCLVPILLLGIIPSKVENNPRAEKAEARLKSSRGAGTISAPKAVGNIFKKVYIFPSLYGTASRREFWWSLLFTLLIVVVAILGSLLLIVGLSAMISELKGDTLDVIIIRCIAVFLAFLLLTLVLTLVCFMCWGALLSWFAVKVRRLHDMGYSGWLAVIVALGSCFAVLLLVPLSPVMGSLTVLSINLFFFLLMGFYPSKTESNPHVE